MNKKKWVTIGILPIMWLIYFLFEFLTGRIENNSETLMMLFLIIPFALVGYLIYVLVNKYKDGFSKKNITMDIYDSNDFRSRNKIYYT